MLTSLVGGSTVRGNPAAGFGLYALKDKKPEQLAPFSTFPTSSSMTAADNFRPTMAAIAAMAPGYQPSKSLLRPSDSVLILAQLP